MNIILCDVICVMQGGLEQIWLDDNLLTGTISPDIGLGWSEIIFFLPDIGLGWSKIRSVKSVCDIRVTS